MLSLPRQSRVLTGDRTSIDPVSDTGMTTTESHRSGMAVTNGTWSEFVCATGYCRTYGGQQHSLLLKPAFDILGFRYSEIYFQLLQNDCEIHTILTRRKKDTSACF